MIKGNYGAASIGEIDVRTGYDLGDITGGTAGTVWIVATTTLKSKLCNAEIALTSG